jgi:branched-chain amino acid transport system substrate-binding protein
MARQFPNSNIAIVNDRSGYGKELADRTREALNAAGKTEVLNESYDIAEKDFSALVSKLKAARIDVVYIGGYHTEAALIARQLRGQDMDTLIVGGDALMTEEYWQAAGTAGEGTLLTFTPDPRKDPANAALVETFRRKGIEPEGYVLNTYAAIQTWRQAVEAAGATDFDAVVAQLDSGDFDTVLGAFSFDASGDVTMPGYVVYQWKNGRYDYF